MRVLLCGGGTGGHIYPVLALARYLINKKAHTEILFVGGERGLENRLVPREGFSLENIAMTAHFRSLLKAPLNAWRLSKSSVQVMRILKEFAPHVVIGSGGYVTAPVIFWASFKKIPTLIHEQNAIPGKANRLLAPMVDQVCLSFDYTKSYFSKKAYTVVTGNPRAGEVQIRTKEEGYKRLGLSSRKKTLLIFGGSQGAENINQVVMDTICKGLFPKHIQVLYVTGERYYGEVQRSLDGSNISEIKLFPYLHDMASALAVSDLVVCRAGATAIAEITARGIPAILIPSPNVVDNHQYHNARIMEESEAGRIIPEKDFTSFTFSRQIDFLFNHYEKLQVMAKNSKSLGKPQALELMYKQVLEAMNCSVGEE